MNSMSVMTPPLTKSTRQPRGPAGLDETFKAAAGLGFAALVVFAVISSFFGWSVPPWLEIFVSFLGAVAGWLIGRFAR